MCSKIAIIPARGGSKRIPRKNIKDFLGKPIIAYPIEVALNSKLFDVVMVSTDDEEIADVARKYGAEVPFMRSEENGSDYASTFEVLEEVLSSYQEQGKTWDMGCCIYPTAPFISVSELDKGFKKLKEFDFDTVFPIVPFSYPIWRGLVTKNQRVEMKWPEYQKSRSQDLESVFHDAGQWYWFSSEKLLRKRQLFTDNSGFLELSPNAVQDIDTLEDWELAELKFQKLHS